MAQAHGERRRTRRPQRELRERAQRDEDGRDEQEQEQEDNGSQEGGAFSQLRGVMSDELERQTALRAPRIPV